MLTAILIAVTAIVAYQYGKRRGKEDMYQLCMNAEQTKREFFSRISLN